MSDNKEVCEPQTLTSEQRNPFKTSESNKTDTCSMTNFQRYIGKPETLWLNFNKGPKKIETCCPDGVSASNLSKCLEDKCAKFNSTNKGLCRSVVEGVDFNSTKTIDEQIKDKMENANITSQNKDEIYRAVIEQLMCNNAIYNLEETNTSSEQCVKTNVSLSSPESKSNLQNCINEYEKTPNADKLRDCVDGLTDKTSTTDKKSSIWSFKSIIDTARSSSLFLICLVIIAVVAWKGLFSDKFNKWLWLYIVISIVLCIGIA